MTRFPLRYARRNVLIGPGGEAAALYRADTVAYPFLPTAREVGAAPPAGALRPPRGRRLLALAGPALLSRPSATPAELADCSTRATATPRAGGATCEGHEARLRELGSHCPRSISPSRWPRASGGPSALRSFGRVRRRVEELAGVGGAAADLRRRAGGAGGGRAAHLRAR